MSKKNRRIINAEEAGTKAENNSLASKASDEKKGFWKGLGGLEKIGVLGLCLLLVGGVLGSGLGASIIDTFTGSDSSSGASANSRNSSSKSEASFLSKLNPFAAEPSPSNTPQLSKEYIYAGSRMLAVEDAGATAAPPADVAIWRPSTGTWWVMGSTGSQQTVQQWGIASDIALPADYDGDGKTDFCVYREVANGTSQWFIYKSSDNSTTTIYFGTETLDDKPAPADYDGDGKTDIAVYRPGSTNGTWYISRSSDSTLGVEYFGLTNDKPTPADYDGDGKADVSVWRNSDTNFYTKQSSDNAIITKNFTQSSSEPVSADYDGDGKADYAIRNSSNWIILNSSTNLTDTIAWQQAGDTAVQNDFDGDGKTDIATWRNSNGNWYIRQSSRIGQSNELKQVAWGTSGDIPVPAFYRR